MSAPTYRGTTNRNARGSSEDRRRRREWLVVTFGDGQFVQCSTCPEILTVETVTVDRWPLAGAEGGTYVRGNIRPMCAECNSSAGGRLGAERKAARRGR
ncbi:HNH endonuclease [Gordonia phage Puppers]|nr:HNH endonuclease [Gordonia phage Puppers]